MAVFLLLTFAARVFIAVHTKFSVRLVAENNAVGCASAHRTVAEIFVSYQWSAKARPRACLQFESPSPAKRHYCPEKMIHKISF